MDVKSVVDRLYSTTYTINSLILQAVQSLQCVQTEDFLIIKLTVSGQLKYINPLTPVDTFMCHNIITP